MLSVAAVLLAWLVLSVPVVCVLGLVCGGSSRSVPTGARWARAGARRVGPVLAQAASSPA